MSSTSTQKFGVTMAPTSTNGSGNLGSLLGTSYPGMSAMFAPLQHTPNYQQSFAQYLSVSQNLANYIPPNQNSASSHHYLMLPLLRTGQGSVVGQNHLVGSNSNYQSVQNYTSYQNYANYPSYHSYQSYPNYLNHQNFPNYNLGGVSLGHDANVFSGHLSFPRTQFPVSPVLSENSASHSSHPDKNIDFLLLVNYTVSPAGRRRKRASVQGKEVREQAHVCMECGKSFQKPYNLRSHMKSHSSDRPFKCLVCSKTFARSHDRKRHEQLHAGQKNYKCEGYLKDERTRWGCGKCFARSDALARHFRTETGWLCIKPFMDEAREQESHGATNFPSHALPPLRHHT